MGKDVAFSIVQLTPDTVAVFSDARSITNTRSSTVGFNILGTQGSGIGIINSGDFQISKTFLPQLMPASAKLSTFDAKASSNVQLNANIADHTVKVLASPFLSSQSGTQATFRQGGEVGVVVAGTGVATVDYRSFGLSLIVTPIVHIGGEVLCNISLEVSAPSQADNKTNIQFAIANTSNRALIKEGQSLVLSGISNESKDRLKSGIPYLRKIPVLSFLFSDKNTLKQNEDLVIVLTPHVKYLPVERSECIFPTGITSLDTISRMRHRDSELLDTIANPGDLLSAGESVDLGPEYVQPVPGNNHISSRKMGGGSQGADAAAVQSAQPMGVVGPLAPDLLRSLYGARGFILNPTPDQLRNNYDGPHRGHFDILQAPQK